MTWTLAKRSVAGRPWRMNKGETLAVVVACAQVRDDDHSDQSAP